MVYKVDIFHKPAFRRRVEVAHPLKSDPYFSAIPHLKVVLIGNRFSGCIPTWNLELKNGIVS